MGNCKYCSKPAGLFRHKHKECEAKYLEEKRQREQKIESDKKEILALAESVSLGQGRVEDLQDKIKSASDSLDTFTSQRLLIEAWGRAVDKCLEDKILSADEEANLTAFLKTFSIIQGDADKNGAYTRVAQAAVLRDLVEGKIPERVKIQGNMPFNLKKDEKIVWLFKGVQYIEQKTRRQFVGGSQGVSIRIARGVYYRVGAFKGQPVERTESVHVDTGMLAVTDQHLYFGGSTKSFRVPYNKIVSFTPYSDGIGIQRDAASAKPQAFIVGDGWFVNNLVTNLSRVQGT